MAFERVNEIHSYMINGLPVKTGDLICTSDGGASFIQGQFWRMIGKLIPGEVDHIVIYAGPGGRCVEAGAKKLVIEFYIPNGVWNAEAMAESRGGLLDQIYGVADPVAGRGKGEIQENAIRINAVNYCIQQAKMKKPYNLAFNSPDIETAYYCSQLAYKAYLPHGINLNTNRGVPDIPFTQTIVFPQEVWEECRIKTKA